MRQFLGILIATTLLAATSVATAQNPPTDAQADHGVVGYEVFSTSTPGGGGKLQSQGVKGKKSPWIISKTAASRIGVSNVVVTYYHCKDCRDKAKADKKKAADLKKKAEADKKKKKDEPEKKDPPKGKDVPSYDKRFWDWKDGKLVPKDDHSKCPKPEKFECGQHYLWWLKNHKHAEPKKSDDNDHGKCDKPAEFKCGAHYQWWLRNHKHISAQNSSHSMLPNKYQMFVTGTVVPGEPVSGTVLDSEGTVASGVVLELSNGEEIYTDEYGRFSFIAPEDLDTIVLTIAGTEITRRIFSSSADRAAEHILNRYAGLAKEVATTGLIDPGYNKAGAVDPIFNKAGGVDPEFNKAGGVDPLFREEVRPPQFGQIGQTMEVTGHFPAGSRLTLDGDHVQVLASSPTAMTVILDPSTAPGQHTFELHRDGEIRTLASFYAIKLQIEPGDRTLMIGQRGSLRVRVLGTDLSVPIQIDNTTPQILKLLCKGELYSSGGTDNHVQFDVMAKSAGAYHIKLKPKKILQN